MTKSASKETSTRSSGGHFLSGAEPVDEAVDDACRRAVDDDGPRDREHLGGHACHKALCLCQDRDEGNFCPILLGFWILKFLKKSAFFAKLL